MVAQFVGEGVEVEVLEQYVDSLRAHLGDELVGVGVVKIVVGRVEVVVNNLDVLFLGDEVELVRAVEVRAVVVLLALEHAWLYDDILLVVDYRLQLLRRDTEQVSNLVGE